MEGVVEGRFPPMSKAGPDFYDNPGVFEIYSRHRAKPDCPNETIEQPILWKMMGSPQGLKILDLGCGDARVARKFREAKAGRYVGIEGSKRMYVMAQRYVLEGFSEIKLQRLEDFVPTDPTFDLVISSLVFHYIEDLEEMFLKVNQSLRPGGRFIFSVEHPVITSCHRSMETSRLRESWLVDDYFARGERRLNWMGDVVTKYHRTVEDFLDLLSRAGFRLERLKEAEPPAENFRDKELLARRLRIPLFLMISAEKISE